MFSSAEFAFSGATGATRLGSMFPFSAGISLVRSETINLLI